MCDFIWKDIILIIHCTCWLHNLPFCFLSLQHGGDIFSCEITSIFYVFCQREKNGTFCIALPGICKLPAQGRKPEGDASPRPLCSQRAPAWRQELRTSSPGTRLGSRLSRRVPGRDRRAQPRYLHQLKRKPLVEDAIDAGTPRELQCVHLVSRALDPLFKVHPKLLDHPTRKKKS